MARSEAYRARRPAEIAALEAEALRWVGTPWMDNSATIGVGVCCHRLVAHIYCSAGWTPDLDVPGGSGGWARYANVSLMRRWLDSELGRAWFLPVPAGTSAEPGDMCLFRCGHVEHHLAVILSANRFVHAPHSGVEIAEIVPAWDRFLRGIWRPIPQ